MSTLGFRCAMDRMGSPRVINAKQVTCSLHAGKNVNHTYIIAKPSLTGGFLFTDYSALRSTYFCSMQIEQLYKLYLQYPSVQTDTRKLKAGDIFFALKGDNFNGNAFAEQAIQAGASWAVIDEVAYEIPGKTFLVDDVLSTPAAIGKHHREQFSIPFIAITGSNGKTTTKELVHAVLSSTYKTYTTEGLILITISAFLSPF